MTTPEVSSDYRSSAVIGRPDGFYWQSRKDGKEYGPFATLLAAIQDMKGEGGDLEPGETREEAEDELAVADWIDPETGQPAEESVPRIEDRDHHLGRHPATSPCSPSMNC